MRPVIDHVPFAGASLDDLVSRFENAGFAPRRGGAHVDADTEMAAVVLPDGSYLELLAPADPTTPRVGHWPAFLDADAGPCAWCVDAGSVHGELRRAIGRDVTVRGPVRGRRETEAGTAEWDLGFLGPDTALPFVISDRTPREYRVPDSDLYGSPVSGIGRVVLAVPDLEDAVERFTDFYRLSTAERDVDSRFGELAGFPGQDVVLSEPDGGPLEARVERFGACPAAVLLEADVSEAATRHPLTGGCDLLGERVRFVEGFDSQLGVVQR